MSTRVTVTRISHACQLIQIGGTRVLTDPWFTQTATYCPGEPVASSAAGLGHIDAVVVSHEHYDQCDLDALAVQPGHTGRNRIHLVTVRHVAVARGEALVAQRYPVPPAGVRVRERPIRPEMPP